MTDNNKPEWFEIIEGDEPAVPPRSSKTLPAAAVIAATLIIGFGAVAGQIQQDSPAVATQENVTPTDSVSSPADSPSPATATPPSVRVVNPSILTLPTSADDEDDDEYEDDEYEDDEDDEYEDDEDDEDD